MTSAKSSFLQTLFSRGFIDNTTNEAPLDALLVAHEQSGTPLPFYIGFDCTAPSLHVGSLVQIMTLRFGQQHGLKPIILMGGGTTKIGDPSGKDESRKMLDDNDIASNMDSIKQIFSNFVTFEETFDASTTHAFMVNNDDWLKDLNYIDFLRDYGRLFSINKMLTRESVKLRLERENHLSFLEFNYMILQAYDFHELYKSYGCRLQFGGSDQWGNIVGGIELHHKATEHSDTKEGLFGATTPLITTASGKKMGKTADGAVWLNADQLSAYDYWQFWRNIDDADVGRFLRLFTDLDMPTITTLEQADGAAINDSKIALANAATALCRGEEAAKNAHDTAQQLFIQGTAGGDLPEFQVTQEELSAGIAAYKLFMMVELEASGGAAKRLIKGGGAKINDEKVIDGEMIITDQAISEHGHIKLSAGKKRHALLVLQT